MFIENERRIIMKVFAANMAANLVVIVAIIAAVASF